MKTRREFLVTGAKGAAAVTALAAIGGVGMLLETKFTHPMVLSTVPDRPGYELWKAMNDWWMKSGQDPFTGEWRRMKSGQDPFTGEWTHDWASRPVKDVLLNGEPLKYCCYANEIEGVAECAKVDADGDLVVEGDEVVHVTYHGDVRIVLASEA